MITYHRALLVGERLGGDKPPGAERAFLPSGASGRRLARMLGVADAIELFDLINADTCASFDDLVKNCEARHVVLLGQRVLKWARRTMGLHALNKYDMALTPVVMRDQFKMNDGTLKFVYCVPHPSGRCRWWNDKRNAELARETLLRIAKLASEDGIVKEVRP